MLGIPKWIVAAVMALIAAFLAALVCGACVFNPSGGTPGGDDDDDPIHLPGLFPGSVEVGPPLVAQIWGCWFEGEGTPEYLGHLFGREEKFRCGVKDALECVGRLTDGAGNIREFPLLPSGQEDLEWTGSFLPNLGLNGLQVSCTGDQGTAPDIEMVPDFGAMEFTFVGGGVQVVSPGHYRGEVTGNVTRCWNIPGADPATCQGEATVGGNPAPQYGFGGPRNCPVDCLGPAPINGAPAEVVFWLTADPGYRTGVIYEILPSP